MTQTLVFPEGHFRHFISVEEFYRMTRAGVFPEGVRFELLEGEIFEMDAMDDPHAEALRWLDQEAKKYVKSWLDSLESPFRFHLFY